MMYYFVSDYHLNHANVINHCERPFTSIKEHDEFMVERWNETIQSDKDHVFMLGDFIWSNRHLAREILGKLRGHISFIRGNHDATLKAGLLDRFELVEKYHELTIQDPEAPGGKQMIVLCHYPFESWNRHHYGTWHLHGHSHGKHPPSTGRLRLDVGIDNIKKIWGEYRPVSYEEIKQYFLAMTTQNCV